MSSRVIAIFDVGKTNKKLLLFDEEYRVVFEKSENLSETLDEDGFPCEDLEKLADFITTSLVEVLSDPKFQVTAVNFSAYGASFVLIGRDGKPICPLYNYLKPYPEDLLNRFYDSYGGREAFAAATASPVLGSLNSGMQLFRLKHERPDLFEKIKYALHLPQFVSYLISGTTVADLTSIGCHTSLWDFRKRDYHRWVDREMIRPILPEIVPADSASQVVWEKYSLTVGVGLHDSSAALIPYLKVIDGPFVLISTGTWSISLNPFNDTPLTDEELRRDCLSYLTFEGNPVKASRLFAGREYDEQVRRISAHFHMDEKFFNNVPFDTDRASRTARMFRENRFTSFEELDLATFNDESDAYYYLIDYLVYKQEVATRLIMKGGAVSKIIVDGGFSKNEVFMNLLASRFDQDVYAASMSQGTALGAAMAIHEKWNTKGFPKSVIKLRQYPKVAVLPS